MGIEVYGVGRRVVEIPGARSDNTRATYLGSQFAVILFMILVWILNKKRKILSDLVLIYLIQTIVIYGLKYLVNRDRPFFFLEISSSFLKYSGEVLDPSFPSAHTAYSFMMATLLSGRFPRYRVIFYIIAGFVGWTRIYMGVHYPTDVIAGVLLGYGITKLLHLWVDRSNIITPDQSSNRKL